MKTNGTMDVYLQAFLSSALDGAEWSDSGPSRFTPAKSFPLDRRLGGPHSQSEQSG
jgi:hypothetical protein